MIYTVVLFVAFFLAFRYLKFLQTPYLNPWVTPLVYALKVAVGFYFLYIYTAFYGNGSLSADAGAFMEESAILNKVIYQSPVDYFKLLFGIGDQDALVQVYLQKTSHWDSGAQAIISDNRNILRVHSLIHFISRGDAAIHVLVMCIFSLIGMQQLYLGVRRHTSLSDLTTFALLALFPSILFWTSGILKEPLLFLGIGLFVRGILDRVSTRKKWFLILAGATLIMSFKPYVLICAVPAILFFALYRMLPRYKALGALLILFVPLIIALASLSGVREQIAHVFSRKQFDFKNVGRGGLHAQGDTCFYFFEAAQIPQLEIRGDSVKMLHPMDIKILKFGSIDAPIPAHLEPRGETWFIYFRNDRSDGFIETQMINDSFGQLMRNVPEALMNTLFRPYYTDPGSWLKYPAMLEVFLLFLFLAVALFRRRSLPDEHKALIGALLIFVVALCLTIGWVTPVLGAIVRYRIPAFAALLIIALLIYDSKKKTHG